MYTVAITGGIAMGKSTVSAYLCEAFPQQRFFDADATVSTLLTRPEICAKIAREFGESVLTADGQIDRPYLREQVFDSVDRRAVLESILHPAVRNEFFNARSSGEGSSASLLIADIPLLFESANDYGVESVLVVASDSVTQMSRLLDRPGIDRETGRQMVAAQLPIEQKMARADHVIWNAGSRRILEKQTKQFASWLRKKIQNPKS
jgi:dephospho-CoA kinase